MIIYLLDNYFAMCILQFYFSSNSPQTREGLGGEAVNAVTHTIRYSSFGFR